jgi:hypothetical protein
MQPPIVAATASVSFREIPHSFGGEKTSPRLRSGMDEFCDDLLIHFFLGLSTIHHLTTPTLLEQRIDVSERSR